MSNRMGRVREGLNNIIWHISSYPDGWPSIAVAATRNVRRRRPRQSPLWSDLIDFCSHQSLTRGISMVYWDRLSK